jgi:peptide/nickel transport system substrate-binding protein
LNRWKLVGLGLATSLLVTGCTTAGGGPTGQPAGTEAGKPAAFKRITAALLRVPATLDEDPSGEMKDLLTRGLAIQDSQGNMIPQLGEAVPTVENGLWKVFPDGRMETTWRVRRGATWHDGAPFTAEDLVFATMVEQDREVALRSWAAYGSVESVEAPDSYTITVRWKKPYIEADQLFARTRAPAFALPKHLLEQDFRENKANFGNLPYWSSEWVGNGPFRLREWSGGSHAIFVANDQYLLGWPKIDEILVKFIADANTLMANILAGAVDMTLGLGMTTDQQFELQGQWRDGQVLNEAWDHRISLFPQFINPNPPALTDVRFRRALVHAIDRQAMSDTLQHGIFPIPHTYMSVRHPWYKTIESFIVRYDYDPRRARQILEESGYRPGPDGMIRDAAGQPLAPVRIQTGGGVHVHETAMYTSANYWQQVGVPTETFITPRGYPRDERSTRPGFHLQRRGADLIDLFEYHTSQVPVPENRFQGGNLPRYGNKEFDPLLERFVTTIAPTERQQLLGPIIHHLTDQVVDIGILYDGEPIAMANRLVNVFAKGEGNSPTVWNVLEWDVRS